MKNKYRVTHKGEVFTRNSATRSYSHVVLEERSRAEDRKYVEQMRRETWKMNLKYWTEQANGTLEKFPFYTDEEHAKYLIEAKPKGEKMLALGEEGYVAEGLRLFDEREAKFKPGPNGDTYYVAVGWCGRYDLAQKLASKTPNSLILEATPAAPKGA